MCGEQPTIGILHVPYLGSSPRVRGAGFLFPCLIVYIGIIPACAGSSQHVRQGVRGQRDHPRVYGEQQLDRCERGTNRGSSPRVRGAGHGTGDDKTESGIIPACAGSRLRGFRRISRRWDHPRVCGEQLRPKSNILTTAGSSPRVRGAVAYETGAVGIFGIIPACAGSSRRRHPERGNEWDHPRVCGEQLFLFACAFALWGSSPRVRGADLDDLVLVMGAGIIPACAGSSNLCCASTLSAWDHPRVCGEQLEWKHLGINE